MTIIKETMPGLVPLCLVAVSAAVTFASSEQRLSTGEENDISEYCIGEDFQPSCHGNDVIVMLRAHYGRMKVGRCVQVESGFESMLEDPRYLGCSADVLALVSRQCSGRSQCQLRVSDQTFDNVNSCYSSLKMYLEVGYMCVSVAAETRYCTVSVSSGPQHIVDFGRTRQNSESLGNRCGDRSRPWTVDALTGQRIVVSLIDFSTATTTDDAVSSLTSSQSRHGAESCQVTYGDVIDKAAKKNVSICRRAEQDGGLSRVYVSESNLLQILFTQSADSSSQQHNFIIHVQAVGCSDLVSPSDGAWLRRDGDDVIVGCYTSRQSWHLRCVDGVWTGTVGVCPQHHYQSQPQFLDYVDGDQDNQQQKSNKADSHFATLSMVAVTCSGAALCLIIICVGVACLRRQGRRLNSEKSSVDVERWKPLNGSIDSQSLYQSAATDDVNLHWQQQQQRQQLVM